MKVRKALKTSPGGDLIIPINGILKAGGIITNLSKTIIKKPGNQEEDKG